jgi:cytochrome c oxidase subunit 1
MTDDHAHHDVGFIRKYVFSVDHKVIGVQYTVTSLIFLFSALR